MVTYAENLCLTKKTEAKLDKIKKCIETRAGMVGTTVIALSNNGKDVFEIIPCYMFKSRIYSQIDLFVCGIAENKDAAYKMVEEFIKEYIDSDSKATMREYFEEKFSR